MGHEQEQQASIIVFFVVNYILDFVIHPENKHLNWIVYSCILESTVGRKYILYM